MPEVTEVEDGSKPKYGGEYAKEIFGLVLLVRELDVIIV